MACYSDEWRRRLPWAILATLVYGLGIPAAFVGLLWRHRTTLHQEITIVRLGMLYRRYVAHFAGWELAVMGRKLAITIVFLFSTVFEPIVQAFAALAMYAFPCSIRVDVAVGCAARNS